MQVAKKWTLEEEGRYHLVGQQRAEDVAAHLGQTRPVGAELVAHHHAGDDAHAKANGEGLQPEAVEVVEGVAPGLQPQRLEHREVAREADRQRRKNDVKSDGESELQARQQHRI
jgi:hypothetical protein